MRLCILSGEAAHVLLIKISRWVKPSHKAWVGGNVIQNVQCSTVKFLLFFFFNKCNQINRLWSHICRLWGRHSVVLPGSHSLRGGEKKTQWTNKSWFNKIKTRSRIVQKQWGGGGAKCHWIPLLSLLPLVALEPAQKTDKRVEEQKYTHVYHEENAGEKNSRSGEAWIHKAAAQTYSRFHNLCVWILGRNWH